MKNLRRPANIAISKEPVPKKPRLAEVPAAADRSSNGRRGFIQRPAPSNSGGGGLSFQRDRDFESSESVRGPFPQQPGQQMHHELVTQYKTALAELTFNSKPIITNLTIIAGENVHAAKDIAATICANILEVPSEQKLSSLYLLDSIVKNIGREFIKAFAARLPEVFCKAYRQVDPSIHKSMRHLFGTWKGVFPPQSLHMIEKELGFTTTVNVPSQGTIASRQDSQPQHPVPSIHVNPKYLEARQQLEITRARGTSNDDSGAMMKSIDELRALEGTSSNNSGRSWVGPYAKSIQHQHGDLVNESVHGRNSSVAQVHSDYGPDVSGRSGLGTGRVSETSKEQVFDRPHFDVTISQQNNGLDTNNGFERANASSHVQHKKNFASREIDGMSRSWKNLEEEEYIWDEINSRPTDIRTAADTFVKDHQAPEYYGRSDIASRLQSSQGVNDIEPRVNHEASAEGRILSGPDKNTSHTGTPGYVPKISGTPQGQTLGAVSSLKPKFMKQPFFSPSENHSTVVASSSDKSNPCTVDSPDPGQSTTSSLLAAVVQSGILNSNTLTGRSIIPIQESGLGSSLRDVQPALTSDPHVGFPSSRPLLRNSAPPAKVDHPTLPPCSPPSTLADFHPEKPPTAVKATSNPVSSLLSSLVAKGLISTKSDSVSFTSPKISNQPSDRGPGVPSTSSTPLSSIPGIIDKPLLSITDEPSSFKSAAKVSDDLPQLTIEIKNLIGFEFRTDVVRNLHPAVISDLSGLPHQCSLCGLGIKFQEQLDRHMDWHVARDASQNSSNITSRRWYADSNDWVAGICHFHDNDSATDLLGGLGETSESSDHMVPADENLCACILCGELFDDFYSQGKDEWMFKGAVYLTGLSSESNERTGSTTDKTFLGPIVHDTCISDQVVHDLGLVKMENDA